MAVVVVGDIDVDAMEKDIKERFGKLKNPVNNRPVEAYPVPNHDETLVMKLVNNPILRFHLLIRDTMVT